MTYVITQNCCKDASCVPVCPVDCIRPVDGAGDTEMLYIDPEACIDCGACAEECPVEAIYYEDDLPAEYAAHTEDNERFFSTTLPGRAEPLGSPGGAGKLGRLGVDTPLVANFPPRTE